jgi:hypothetical protein
MLEVADLDAEPGAWLADGDRVGLFHRLERGDVQPLLEATADRAARRPPPPVEHVRRPLAPRGVGHLGDHRVEGTVVAMEEEERDRVESDAEIPRVREQPDRPVRPATEPLFHEVAGALGQLLIAARQVVPVAESHRRGAAGRPQRNTVEQLGQLVEVQQGEENPVAERVRGRIPATVSDASLVDHRGGHAASASSDSGSGSGCTVVVWPSCGSGPRPPSACATRRADHIPSSWKPQRQ